MPKLVAEVEAEEYALKRSTLVIRHTSGDRIIALIEVVSPGNKASRYALRSFVDKALDALSRRYHLLIVDLFPPTPRDPQGLPNVIWGDLTGSTFELTAGCPLTLSAFMAGPTRKFDLEATAVGRELIDMPLFLEPDVYVNVPLEDTYRAAYRGVPRRWKLVLEGEG